MTALNLADAVYLGEDPADAVYLGEELVWSAVPPVPSYGEVVLASNPLVYYRLADSGTAMVDATGKASGSLAGSRAIAASILPNGQGQSQNFTGGRGDGPLYENTVERAWPQTREAWVMLPALPSAQGAILGTIGNNAQVFPSIMPSGVVQIAAQMTIDWPLFASTIALQAGVPYHVAITSAALNDGRIYINGQDVTGPYTARSAPVPGLVRPQVAAANTGMVLQARIQEAAFYDRVLPASEIQAHYAAAQPPS